jgi:hypothetical protein
VTNGQRWVVIDAFVIAAIILPLIFLHFGQNTLRYDVATGNATGYEQIVDLSPLADSLGAVGDWGVWTNPGESFGEAFASGIVAPITLLAAAAYFFLGTKRQIGE